MLIICINNSTMFFIWLEFIIQFASGGKKQFKGGSIHFPGNTCIFIFSLDLFTCSNFLLKILVSIEGIVYFCFLKRYIAFSWNGRVDPSRGFDFKGSCYIELGHTVIR